jgi:hypothetical protein
MRLFQITGYNPSGIGLWQHLIPEKSSVRVEADRMIVAGPSHDPYILLEDGNTVVVKPYPHSVDDGA